jgi:hypothetical protein
MTPEPANTKMNSLIRDQIAHRRQPRDAQGRFAAEEHANPTVPKLLRIRELDAEAGDYAGVAEMNRRLLALDASIAPLRIGGADGGAGRGQPAQLHHNSNDAMNMLLRAGLRQKRERLRELVDEELRQ